MGESFEKNKIFVGIIMASFIIGGFIYLSKPNSSTTSDNSKMTNAGSPNISTENLSFDLDIPNLSYDLPEYTKICLPETRNDCSSDGNCVKNKPVVFLLLNERSKHDPLLNDIIYRCDQNPCDDYLVEKAISGLYTNLSPKIPTGFMVKISSNNEYFETVSFGLDFIINKGKCVDKE